MPVIMMGEQHDIIERVLAPERGADDLVSESLNVRKVLARVAACGRKLPIPRFCKVALSGMQCGFNGSVLDYPSRTGTYLGETVPLLPTEYVLLNLLTSAPWRVLSKGVIALRIWPGTAQQQSAIGVRVHRQHVRIERVAAVPALMRTVRAQGYVFPSLADGRVRDVLRTPRASARTATETMRIYIR